MTETKLDVLNRVIDKAILHGYDGPDIESLGGIGRLLDYTNYYSLIFRHDFAKAIWGEEEKWLSYDGVHATGETFILWKWWLKQMVISNDPLDFLDKNMEYDTWDKIFIQK